MKALQALKTRRSVRTYLNQHVPREIIEDIVDCGRLAATAINIQPWEFVVVTRPAIRNQIADLTDNGKFISRAAACIAVFCKDTKYYLEDGSAATQNILVAACSHGLGSCWVAGDKKPYAEDVRKLLGAPDGFKLVSLVTLGYPSENPQKKKRPLEDVIHWERY